MSDTTTNSCLESIHLNIFSASTKKRISYLKLIKNRISNNEVGSDDEVNSLIDELFLTFNYYNDFASRTKVLEIFKEFSIKHFTNLKENLFPKIIKVSSECNHAPADYLNLIEWLDFFLANFKYDSSWTNNLIKAQANSLAYCYSFVSLKPRIAKSALQHVKSTLVHMFTSKDNNDDGIYSITDLKLIIDLYINLISSIGLNAACIIGTIASTSAENVSAKYIFELFNTHKEKIFQFYKTEFLASKTPIPDYILDTFKPFFTYFVTIEDINSLVPFIERSILRAPEIVLNGVIPIFVSSLPSSLDLSCAFAQNLSSPLLSALGSSKQSIRLASFNTITIMLTHSTDPNQISSVFKNVLTSLKTNKVTSPEVRIEYSRLLSFFPLSIDLVSSNISLLFSTASKESNESVLNNILRSVSKFIEFLIKNNSSLLFEKSSLEVLIQGLKNKKLNIRKYWILNINDALISISIPNETYEKFLSEIFPLISQSWHEVNESLLSFTTQSKFSVTVYSYILIVIHLKNLTTLKYEVDSEIKSIKQSLIMDDKKISLLNDRVYSKFSSEFEYKLVANSLNSLTSLVIEIANKETSKAWSYAWYYLFTSPLVSHVVRNAAFNGLAEAYSTFNTFVADAISNNLWDWFKDIELNIKTSIASSCKQGLNFLHLMVQAIIPYDKIHQKAQKKEQNEFICTELMQFCILFHHEYFPSRNNWIEFCLRASVDPGELVKIHKKKFLDLIKSTVEKNESPKFREAALKAAATLAFISPESFTLELVKYFQEKLNSSLLLEIDDEMLAIWKSPEGVVYKDVLSGSKEKSLNKNSKDYETSQWEAQVRAELANKKGSNRKLTKEEQNRVNEQLEVERKIRLNVQDAYLQFFYGMRLIFYLSEGTNNGIEIWFPPAVESLITMLTSGVTRLLNTDPILLFISLSKHLNERLGQLRYIFGAVLLRALKIKDVPSKFCSEDLYAQTSRILYRIRFVAEQLPLDLVSLSYVLPLILLVIESGGVGSKNKEQAEEQILLALEIIVYHASVFTENISRGPVAHALLFSIKKYPSFSKTSKDAFMGFTQAIAPNISIDELQIILSATVSSDPNVRTTALESIDSELSLPDAYYDEILIERFDPDEVKAQLAYSIWVENDLKINKNSPSSIIKFFSANDQTIRTCAAKALGFSLKELNEDEIVQNVILSLKKIYIREITPPEPEKAEVGFVRKAEVIDHWQVRSGIASGFLYISEFLPQDSVVSTINFFIDSAALGDKNSNVRLGFRNAGISIIKLYGMNHTKELIEVFENYMNKRHNSSAEEDIIHESVIVLYGALSHHLNKTDSRLPNIINRLLDTLKTPSEDVQVAVADVLPPLTKLIKPLLNKYFDYLFVELFNGKNYGERRGAAYGIAGLIKGAGLSALNEYNILSKFVEAVENKKDPKMREGAMLFIECLSTCLGRLFEPFAIKFVPFILSCLGDASTEVRQSSADAAKAIMKNTTGYGVKLLIPITLQSLEDVQWRSKKGAVELLGAMAYLNPTQLSYSLSKIIPEIVDCLNDSHKEVRNTATQSLSKFGDAITNPEIHMLVPLLIKTISDPTKYSDSALSALLKTKFEHYIDAPSLALVIHILERGLRERSAMLKKKSAQIVGNMAMLTEREDLIPYLNSLVSLLEQAMVDPVPATRATACRALGSLVEKFGEDQFPELISRLFLSLKSETSAGDRLGAAQAISEIVSGLGLRKLEELLPSITINLTSNNASVREGYMSLMVFLPASFGASFGPYLNKVIPSILAGLADNAEPVRETSLRAGRLIINNFSAKAVDLLLPELQNGMSDQNYRIRLSSVELTGELLYQITGVTKKIEDEEIGEENESNTEFQNKILQVLGEDRRNRVLSSIFVCRSDTSAQVRAAASSIWKSLVVNTPKTIKEILSSLTQIIISHLSSQYSEQKAIGTGSLGELVRRVGDNILDKILASLETELNSESPETQQGVCLAVKELISSTSIDTLQEYQTELINIVKSELISSFSNVREAAAQTFDVLHATLGKSVIDKIIPDLLNLLQSDKSELSKNVLSALQAIMSIRSDSILPILIPTLISEPITSFNARALGSLVTAAGGSAIKNLSLIIKTLINAEIEENPENYDSVCDSIDKILLSINDDAGPHSLMQIMLSLAKNESNTRRRVTFKHMAVFFKETSLDFSPYQMDWVRECLYAFSDRDEQVVTEAWTALTVLVSKLSKEELDSIVINTCKVLQSIGYGGESQAGFCRPKGPSCVLPIFMQGLMYGSPDKREYSAVGISLIADYTDSEYLKTYVTQMTGPLIRTVGERFSSDVKSAILKALYKLLTKIPTFMKPFFPQLQRTFVKSLSDPSNSVLRRRAAKALGILIKFQPRVDPLISELVQSYSSTNDNGVSVAILNALNEIIEKAGSSISESSRTLVLKLVEGGLDNSDQNTAIECAKILGGLVRVIGTENGSNIIKEHILPENGQSLTYSSVLALNAVLKEASSIIIDSGLSSLVANAIIEGINNPSSAISDLSTIAAGKYLLSFSDSCGFDAAKALVSSLAKAVTTPVSTSIDTRRLSLVVIKLVALKNISILKPHFHLIVPAVFACVREIIIPIKLAAEQAFLAIFQMSTLGDKAVVKWLESNPLPNSRSILEYTRRIAMRLVDSFKERVEAGGDKEVVYSDKIEDENEIWAVGGIRLDSQDAL